MDTYLLNHHGHDYEALISRWRKLPLHQSELSNEGDYSVLALENDAARRNRADGIYLSAGVHGDECAPVWALLEWAEENLATLVDSTIPFLIFPCLNPHGLIENQRTDHRGDDLNRIFQDAGHSLIGAWQQFIEGRKFRLTINLHEDYDARGIYLYQLPKGDFQPGEEFLESCQEIIPRDAGAKIDGSAFQNGLLTHGGDMGELVESELGGGYPEAIWLYQNQHLAANGCAQTFETPSEFALTDRVKAHRHFLEVAVSRGIEQG